MSSHKEIAERLLGDSAQNDQRPSPPEAEGAVNTPGGIEAALSISPNEMQQVVRKAILNPVQMGNPDGMTAMNSSDDRWKDALAGTLDDYGMEDAVDLYGNASVGPRQPAEPPTLPGDPNVKLHDQMFGREVARSALRPKDGDAESGIVRATFMLNAASKHSYDDVMSAWQLSRKLNVPFEMTLDNLAAARLAASEIVPDDIRNFAPAFLRLVQDDYDAAILWLHDLDTANAVAEAFSPVDAVADTFVPMPSDDFDNETSAAAIGRGISTGGLRIAQDLLTLGKASVDGIDGLAEDVSQYVVEGITSAIKPDALPVGKPFTEPPAVSRWLGDMAQRANTAIKNISADAPYADKQIWDNPEVMLDSRWWLENGISTAISALPAIAASVAKGGLAAGATVFVMEASNMYNELIADGMPDNFRIRAYATIYGLASGVMGITDTSAMFGGIPAVKAAFKKMLAEAADGGMKQAVKHHAGQAGTAFTGEGGKAWLQNVIKSGLESAAKGNTGEQVFNDMLESAKKLENAVLGGALGSAVAGAHSHSAVRTERLNLEVRRASHAPERGAAREETENLTDQKTEAQSRMAFAQSLKKTAAAADASAVHKDDPALFAQEAAKLIPEEARTVWLDVSKVQEFTQGNPARMAALGLTHGEMDNAVKAQAQSVPVSTMAIVSQFKGKERQTLMQSARQHPEGMTQKEAQSVSPAARSKAAATRVRKNSNANARQTKKNAPEA